MRPDLIVLFEPLIDHGLSLSGCAKPFGIENFSAKRAVEPLIIPSLPWRPGVDPDGLDADFGQPVFEGL